MVKLYPVIIWTHCQWVAYSRFDSRPKRQSVHPQPAGASPLLAARRAPPEASSPAAGGLAPRRRGLRDERWRGARGSSIMDGCGKVILWDHMISFYFIYFLVLLYVFLKLCLQAKYIMVSLVSYIDQKQNLFNSRMIQQPSKVPSNSRNHPHTTKRIHAKKSSKTTLSNVGNDSLVLEGHSKNYWKPLWTD